MLSEKPVAEDVKTATSLIEWYESLKPGQPLWGVAENFRFMEPFLKAADLVKELKNAGGHVVTFRVDSYGAMGKQVQYFHTEWYACTASDVWSLLTFRPGEKRQHTKAAMCWMAESTILLA